MMRIVRSLLDMLFFALQVVIAFAWVLIGSLFRAVQRQLRLKEMPKESLSLHLLAARLADLPYQVESADHIAAAIATLLWDSRLLHYEEQALMQTNSNWFLCEGRPSAQAPKAIFLVFRGTMSPTDAIADVLFRPESGPNGVKCHGGFLRTVREDVSLHAQLAKYLPGAAELYILGHSLGGALSQTVAGAGFLPAGFNGQLTIVTLGGPMAFFGAPNVAALDGPTAGARVISIVNANDIVPRLLGCPLSFSRKVLGLFAASASQRKQQEHRAILDTLEGYQGLPGYELIFLYNKAAYAVPSRDHRLVLHLAEALHPRCIADHLTYVDAAEAAAGATHWQA